MNKYILRTSLVWIGIIAVFGGGYFLLHSRTGFSIRKKFGRSQEIASSNMQPVAAGPAVGVTSPSMAQPAKMDQAIQASLAPVQISPERMQSIGVTIGSVEYKNLSDDIRATGTVSIDERLVAYVQVRFPGYIRKVFANATYQYVHKGEPLFTIYSPDLVATEQEYLLAEKNQKSFQGSSVDSVAAGANLLANAAEQRLQQWDVSASEIEQIKKTGEPIPDLIVASPVSGYITEFNALPNLYVEPATRLYTVANLSSVWIDAQVFQDDVGHVKPGDAVAVTVDAYPGQTFHGHMEEVLPQVDMSTRTARVRIAMANPGLKLKPGMYVNVDFKTSLGRQLMVPASAVFQTGTRALVFVDEGGGNLRPQDVKLGPQSGDSIVILSGLKAKQKVVTSANFLIDSESQLQAAAGSFLPPQPGAGNAAAPISAQATIDFTSDPTPPHKGGNIFRVKLTNATGASIAGAQVAVTFFMPSMPAMGMSAMNTTLTLIEKGNGQYEGHGKLDSGGTWQVTITAKKNGSVLATKQLHVNAEGGM